MHALKQFNLKNIGIDQDSFFKSIHASFDNLPLDIYEQKRQQVLYLKNKFSQHQNRLQKFLIDYHCSKASLNDINDILALLSDSEIAELKHIGEVRYRTIAKFEILFNTARVR